MHVEELLSGLWTGVCTVGNVVKWAVVGSVGWLVYGIPKTVLEWKRKSDWSAKLQEATERIQEIEQSHLQLTSASPHQPISQKDIRSIQKIFEATGRKDVDKTPGTEELQRLLLNEKARLELFKQSCEAEIIEHDKHLKHAELVCIPLVGAFIASRYIGHTGVLTGLTQEITKEIPASSMSRVFFCGNQTSCKVRAISMLINGTEYKGAAAKKQWEKNLGAEQRWIEVAYCDGDGKAKTRKIEAMVLRGKETSGPHEKTVVVSHGVNNTLYGSYELAKKYQELGYNVLVPTLGGKQYGQVEPPADSHNDEIETNELTLYQDVDAVMLFLKNQGVQEVGWHGHSLGGASMAQAAVKYGKGVKGACADYPVVEFIVADQTFTSGEATTANFANNFLGYEWEDTGRTIGLCALPKGKTDGVNVTSGLNNNKKMKSLVGSQVRLFAVVAPQDHLMGTDWDKVVCRYEGNFPVDLFDARYPKGKPVRQILELEESAPHGYDVAPKLELLIPRR